jgi:dienelactone hydrolase
MLRRPAGTIEIPTADGAAVRGDIYLPVDRSPSGLVILCHGFKGYKTWGFFPYLAGRLSGRGLAALALDFSYNGTFPDDRVDRRSAAVTRRPGTAPSNNASLSAPRMVGPPRHTRYPRPDLFRDNTLTREVGDLASTLRFVDENGLGDHGVREVPVGLFGHSRGGVSAILNALENERVKALCTWSTPVHPDHFTARQKTIWRRCGEYDFTDASDGTSLSLSTAYLDDLENNHDFYDLRRRAATLRVPHLIVHGEMDLAVPVESARALHEAERQLQGRRIVLLRSGHTFGVSDPPGMDPEDPPGALVEACDATGGWFDTYLTKGV